MKEITIKVEGMVCGGCENRIKNALLNIDGVKAVNANHENGIVTITANNNVEQLIVEKAIEDIGFDVIR